MATTLKEFNRAVQRLEEAILQPKDEFVRDSVIQRFEFSVELAWKTAKKVMGTATSPPKDVIREMAQGDYISDVDVWLKSIDMRNLSSHTYKEVLAEQVYSFACEFLPELQNLAAKLSSK